MLSSAKAKAAAEKTAVTKSDDAAAAKKAEEAKVGVVELPFEVIVSH